MAATVSRPERKARWWALAGAVAFLAALAWGIISLLSPRSIPIGEPLEITSGKLLIADPAYLGYESDAETTALLTTAGRIADQFSGDGAFLVSTEGNTVTIHTAEAHRASPPGANYMLGNVGVDTGRIAVVDGTAAMVKLGETHGGKELYMLVPVANGAYQVRYQELKRGNVGERLIVVGPVE